MLGVMPSNLDMGARPHVAYKPVQIIKVAEYAERAEEQFEQPERIGKNALDKACQLGQAKMPAIVCFIHI